MPRKFRTDEEETIRGALLEAAARIMGARGVRKTTIDELVREGGISKGSFYRFFPGKEALALELLARWERDFHLHIRRFFQESAPRGVGETAETLRAIFMEEFPRRVAESGLQGLMQPDEVAYLARAADPEHTSLMDQQDLRLFAELKPLLRAAGLQVTGQDEVVMAGLRLVFDAALGILASELTVTTARGANDPRRGAPSGDSPGTGLDREHFVAALTLIIRGLLSEACRPEDQHHE